MLYEIGHVLQYDYDVPVALGPHTLRLLPRAGADQRLADFRYEVRPSPAQVTRNLDLDGNDVLRMGFDKPVRSLLVRLKSQVETLRKNPFDYVAANPRLPADYAEKNAALLRFRGSADTEPALAEFCRELRGEAGDNTGDFLYRLCRRIHEAFGHETREEGSPWEPARTWREKRGACRDLAVLFMDCARRAGLAARFVSGYYEDDTRRRKRDLHAWAEVYVEGGGWRGFDPASGLAAADRHVAVATGAEPSEAAPVEGTFSAGGKSTLRYAVSMTRLA